MDLIELILWIVVAIVIIFGIRWAYLFLVKRPKLSDIRGMLTEMLRFSRAPTVPTIRIISRYGIAALELGRRARVRENSLYDSYDKKGWDITSEPTPIKAGNSIELGYITHPTGCTVALKPDIKIIRVDENGLPILSESGEVRYIEASFEGVIGRAAELDDFDRSINYEKEGNWALPFVVGCIVGVILLSPVFAWLMTKVSGH